MSQPGDLKPMLFGGEIYAPGKCRLRNMVESLLTSCSQNSENFMRFKHIPFFRSANLRCTDLRLSFENLMRFRLKLWGWTPCTGLPYFQCRKTPWSFLPQPRHTLTSRVSSNISFCIGVIVEPLITGALERSILESLISQSNFNPRRNLKWF